MSSRPSATSASNAPSTRSARNCSPMPAWPPRGAADSIAAYSSAVLGCTGNCLRACLRLSASAMSSNRRTPRGWRRRASCAIGMHRQRSRCRRRRPAPDRPARRRRPARIPGMALRETRSGPSAPGPRRRARRTPPPHARRSGRAARRGRAIRPAPCGHRDRAGAGWHAGAGSIAPASKSVADTPAPVALCRKRASVPSIESAAGCGQASAKARAKSGAGTKLRRSALGSERINAVALSATKPGASHDSCAGSSALSRCSGTATVMPSSTAPGSKR